MSFLYTIFLPALAAVAIPLLLHFFSRQRLPLIDFSSLEFLRRLQKRQARRVQLRQIILLLLRTLALIALVMAFARPALKATGASGAAGSATEMVVVLDDGISSTAQTCDGAAYGIAVERIASLLGLCDVNDRMTVIFATQPAAMMTASSGTQENLSADLTERTPALFRPRLTEALATGDSILKSSERFNRELYIVSPFYGGLWDSLDFTTSVEMRKYLVPVGPERLPNAGIESVKLVSAIRQKGSPVDIETTIHNYGDQAHEALLAGVYLEGERVAQGSVELPAGASITKTFTITPAASGQLSGAVKLEDPDPLAADQRRNFVLDIPEKVRMLAVAGDSLELKILRAVFETGGRDYYDLKLRLAGSWETEPLAAFDVLLLADVPLLSAGATQRVSEFVEQGGGLILMPGSRSDLADLSRGLLARLGLKPIKGINSSGVSWGKLDASHPIFSGVFEAAGSPKSPALTFALDLATGTGDQPVIPLTIGSPFLVERAVGRGSVLLFASPPSPDAGEWIYSGIFAPLLFRAGAFVSRSNGLDDAWETGTSVRPVLPRSQVVELNLVAPDGNMTMLPPRAVIGGVEYDAGFIHTPGIYQFKEGETVVAKFPANPPSGIGSLVRTDLVTLGERLGGATVLAASGEELTTEIRSARYGRELWQPIAAFLLGLLVAETIIGRARKGEGG